MAFRAAGVSSPGGDAFVMHDLGARFVDHLVAPLAQSEAQISILVIGWSQVFIESANFTEKLRLDEQTSTGAIIDLPLEIEHGFSRIVGMSVIPAVTIAPDDVAGFLQTPVRVE